MNFLLIGINAKYIHSNPAIYSLRAFAGDAGQEHVTLAEYTINEQIDVILEDIYRRKPDAIGFSCYLWNISYVKKLLRELPKLLPDCDLWLGGPEVSFNAPEVLREFSQLCGIMIGEGEATFREVLEEYLAGEGRCPIESDGAGSVSIESVGAEKCSIASSGAEKDAYVASEKAKLNFEDIRGLCLASGFTGERAPLDMDEIPFFYDDLTHFQNKILYYESSRGCPFHCSYCLSSVEKCLRLRSVNLVKPELQFFLDHRVPQVKFVDRTFNCSREHTRAIWEYLLEHDNGVTNFHFEVSADLLNQEEIALLRRMRPGLVQLEIGVQSTNEATIGEIHRTMDLSVLEGIVAQIHEGKNVHQHLDLIVGLPFEDYSTFRESFNRVYAMQPNQLQMGFLKVLKGSYMAEHAEEYELRSTEYAPYEVLSTKWISYPEVRKLHRVEEMLELYYNSGQFTNTMAVLVPQFDSPFDFFEMLADYYEEQHYFTNMPARAARYEILLRFVESRCNVTAAEESCEDSKQADRVRMEAKRHEALVAAVRELLLFDLYLRENLKSRPPFAEEAERAALENAIGLGKVPDQAAVKQKIRAFFDEEAKTHQALPNYAGYDARQLARQAHMELFAWPVRDPEEMLRQLADSERTKSDLRFCLFDYSRRDPLDKNAFVTTYSL
ncbi:MAG: B12-binding domain-containing radical SAM protein [Lachnospiraceae bacterium]|nr:B12-binding domain-containing radical SAM protein [Lachnospiraceae bacterium]